MSEMKHTPGPWLRAEGCIYSLMQDGWRKGDPLMVNRVTISTYFHKEVSDEEREATRNLIVIAPDLLAAIRYAVDNPDFKSDVFDQMARAAIAKAQGHVHE